MDQPPDFPGVEQFYLENGVQKKGLDIQTTGDQFFPLKTPVSLNKEKELIQKPNKG